MRKRIVLAIAVLVGFLIVGCSTGVVSDKPENKAITPNQKLSTPTSAPVVKENTPNPTTGDDDNNTIDKAFERDFSLATTTAELNYVSEEYYTAWKCEWDNIISQLKSRYKYEADKKSIDQYEQAYEAFVKQASEVECLRWSDSDQPPGPNRNWGTGATTGSNMEQAELYKRQVLYLIKSYSNEFDRGYKYIYKGNGAQLEKKISEMENEK